MTSSLSQHTSEMLNSIINDNSTAAINMTIKTQVQIVIIGFQYRTKLMNKNVAHCFYFLVPVIRRACCAVATRVGDIAHSAAEIKEVTVGWSWTSNTNEGIRFSATIFLITNESNSCSCVHSRVNGSHDIESFFIAIYLQR